MALGEGDPTLLIGLLDGPVAVDHVGLAGQSVVEVTGGDGRAVACVVRDSAACRHGTLVAGVLVAQRGLPAPGVCPGCRLLVRPIFSEGRRAEAMPQKLAAGIVECVAAGARIVNVSAAFIKTVSPGGSELTETLEHAARRGAIVVAAAGNEARIGGSPLTSHPWVIPVTSCDGWGRPLAGSNMGASIARHGLRAPGTGIMSLNAAGGYAPLHGTSGAAALVTGAIALAWSAVPTASAGQVRAAVTGTAVGRRGLVPPLLDALALYQALTTSSTEVSR